MALKKVYKCTRCDWKDEELIIHLPEPSDDLSRFSNLIATGLQKSEFNKCPVCGAPVEQLTKEV